MFFIDTLLWWLFLQVCCVVGAISVGTYLLGLAIQQIALRVPQNLKHKYSADWALVTGSSSGIGRAIAEKLAGQKINVVLVALDDELLANTFSQLQKQYPDVQFRKVGCDLGSINNSYMAPIVKETEDIHVNLIFNNAGYICTGLFADTELARLQSNLTCNAGCAVPITHHFVRLMMERGQKGLVTFTSSAACYLPGPTATMYSPSKAFLTNFATTLASEVRDVGIHVVVIHPSPVNTNFYKNQGPALQSLQTAQKAAISPAEIAQQIFASAGRLVVWDQGLTCAIFRVVNKVIDFQLFSELVSRFAWVNEDHKKLAKQSKLRNAKGA